MRPVHVLVVGAGVVAVVLAVVLFSPTGLSRLARLEEEERVLTGQVAQKQKQNDTLVDETRLLRGDTEASKLTLEKKAREELGYIAPGEVVVTIPDVPVAVAAPVVPPAPPHVAAPSETH